MVRPFRTGAAPSGAVIRLVQLLLMSLVVAAVTAASADRASASYGPVMADSDGHMPIYSVCHSGYGYLAYYDWSYDGYAVSSAIYVDDCLLTDLGAGPYDRQRIIAHERGHAMGLPHSSDPDSYMYPYYAITGT